MRYTMATAAWARREQAVAERRAELRMAAAAALLGVSPDTVRRRLRDGSLEGRQAGGDLNPLRRPWRVYADSVRAYMLRYDYPQGALDALEEAIRGGRGSPLRPGGVAGRPRTC